MPYSTTNRRSQILTLLFFFSGLISAQQVKVVDALEAPVRGVSLTNLSQTHQVFSDKNGWIAIKEFDAIDTLTISHIGFLSQQMTKEELLKLDGPLVLQFDIKPLGEVILLARINEEKQKTTAGRKVVLPTEEIERLNSPTTAELLENRGGVYVQKSQMGGGSPVIRGFESNRVLLMLDGVRLNNAIYRGGHLQNIISIDNASLEQVDLHFGSSHSMFGSDALGGVIHMKTKRPAFTEFREMTQGLKSRYATANKGFSTHYEMKYTGVDFALYTSISHRAYNDLRMGSKREHGYSQWGLVESYVDKGVVVQNTEPNIQKKTAYSQMDLMQKVIFQLSPNSLLTGNIQYSNSSNIPRFDKLNDYSSFSYDPKSGQTNFQELKYAAWNYGPQKRLFSSFQLDHSLQARLMDTAQVICAYQDLSESRHVQKYNSDERTDRHENIDIHSVNLNFSKKKIRYGFEYQHNKIQSKAYLTNSKELRAPSPQTRYPNGGSSMNTWAIYLAWSKKVSEKMNVNSGLRYTKNQLKGFFHSEKYVWEVPFEKIGSKNERITGSIGVVYWPNPTMMISCAAYTGFHAPNIDDTGKLFYKSNLLTLPNPELKPEHTKSVEFTLSKKIERRSLVSLNAHYTLIEDVIMKLTADQVWDVNPDPTEVFSEIKTNKNAGKAEVYGATASFSMRVAGRLTLESDYTLTKGINRETNLPFPHIPPSFGKTALHADFDSWCGSLLVLYNGRKDKEDYDLASGTDNLEESPIVWAQSQEGNWIKEYRGTPPWYTVNMSAACHLSEHLDLQVAIDNIFDHHYKTFSSGVSSPGRNFILTIKASL